MYRFSCELDPPLKCKMETPRLGSGLSVQLSETGNAASYRARDGSCSACLLQSSHNSRAGVRGAPAPPQLAEETKTLLMGCTSCKCTASKRKKGGLQRVFAEYLQQSCCLLPESSLVCTDYSALLWLCRHKQITRSGFLVFLFFAQ